MLRKWIRSNFSRPKGRISSWAPCVSARSRRWAPLLPDLVPLLHKRAPEMPLEIEENLTVNLTAMLKSGKLDVIMIALPFEEPGIRVQALYDEPSRPLCRRIIGWRRKRTSIPLPRPVNASCCHAGHCFRHQVLGGLPGAQAAQMRKVCRAIPLETIRQMVASGLALRSPCSAVTSRYGTNGSPCWNCETGARAAHCPGVAQGFARPYVIAVIRAAVGMLKKNTGAGTDLRTGLTDRERSVYRGRASDQHPCAGSIARTAGRRNPGDVGDSRLTGLWKQLGQGRTDADGRSSTSILRGLRMQTGTIGAFDVAGFSEKNVATFFPEVPIVFTVQTWRRAAISHPATSSPFGYSTYRGS